MPRAAGPWRGKASAALAVPPPQADRHRPAALGTRHTCPLRPTIPGMNREGCLPEAGRPGGRLGGSLDACSDTPAGLRHLSGYLGDISGYLNDISGYLSDLSGYLSDLSGYLGDISGYLGDISGYLGDLSGYLGDLSG